MNKLLYKVTVLIKSLMFLHKRFFVLSLHIIKNLKYEKDFIFIIYDFTIRLL